MSIRVWPALLMALSLSACFGNHGIGDRSGSEGPYTGLFTRVPESEKPLAKGKLHFRNADYGLAEKNFRQAVEDDPENSEAWLGLAASYDRLKRFDLAERAYKIVIRQIGRTAEVLNNLGYHYYLKGDPAKARTHFDAALAKDPGNPYVLNNMKKLDSSSS